MVGHGNMKSKLGKKSWEHAKQIGREEENRMMFQECVRAGGINRDRRVPV